jgi:rubrerythrin
VTIDAQAVLRRTTRLDLDGIDFTAFTDQPLDVDTLRCLRYMRDVENHTVCYLRDILVTRVHHEPEVTGFLACWAYEEHWHGDAIAQVLQAHDEPATTSRAGLPIRRYRPRRDAWRPVLFAFSSALTRHIVAIEMAWGAVNERTTQAGYAQLAARAHHPVLSELLQRIMKQEGRHIDFYADQARRRLASSSAAQRITRLALRHLWAPVGSNVMPSAEVSFLSAHLFANEAGIQAAQRIDHATDRLPGLAGLNLLERAIIEGTDFPLAG